MSNAKDNRIKQLEEQNAELHKICQRQRDSLAAQQEAIVQLNISLNSTLACLASIYGDVETLEDGTTLAFRVKIPAEEYPGVLDRCSVSAAMKDGCYVITVVPKPQEGEDPQKTEAVAEPVDDGTLHRNEYGNC